MVRFCHLIKETWQSCCTSDCSPSELAVNLKPIKADATDTCLLQGKANKIKYLRPKKMVKNKLDGQ